MGVRILEDQEQGHKVLYDSVTMWAFGPIFYEDDDVEDFLEWAGETRTLTDRELDGKYYEWRAKVENEQS